MLPNRKPVLLVRSVPLSLEVRKAWGATGETRTLTRKEKAHVSIEADKNFSAILNLGNVDLTYVGSLPVYNKPDTVRAISSPSAMHRTLEGEPLVPAADTFQGPHWHKRAGFGGSGKVFHEGFFESCLNTIGAVQRHIIGEEYRIVTVGSRIVQAFRKDLIDIENGLNLFDYEWVGVKGVAAGGFIPALKKAVSLIPGGEMSVIGWDVIHDGDDPHIIEANTSPGVNAATAERILKEIYRGCSANGS